MDFLGTRVGEASHPGPSDIFGAALLEANPLPDQDFPDATHLSLDVPHDAGPVPSVSVAPPGSSPLPPGPSSATLRRPVPLDSAQPPLSKRRAPSSGRWYCQVQSCPDHCPLTSRGWSSFVAMKGHCDRHLGGYLGGDLPLEWLQSVGHGVCEVCNRILSSRSRGRCPSCWLAYVASLPRPVTGRPLSEDMLPLDQVLTARIRLRPSVTRGARGLWGTCLNTAVAGIHSYRSYRDSRAWIDFLLLPSLVLPSPARGGSSRTRRSTNETRRRCQDWLTALSSGDPPPLPPDRFRTRSPSRAQSIFGAFFRP